MVTVNEIVRAVQAQADEWTEQLVHGLAEAGMGYNRERVHAMTTLNAFEDFVLRVWVFHAGEKAAARESGAGYTREQSDNSDEWLRIKLDLARLVTVIPAEVTLRALDSRR